MNFKKTFAVLGACALLTGAVALPARGISAQAVTSEEKTIDMYLIAGQSNAAGYSNKGRKLDGVFENVSYAGEVDRYRTSGTASQSYLTYPFQSAVKEGLGRASGFVGPEYGIAEKLNAKYKGGHKAIVFKSAAGGTGLRNSTGGQNNDFGNWYPRSKWTGSVSSSAPMGVQYQRFVDNFTSVYTQLTEHGYTVKVQGMAWMQGEDDLSAPQEYGTLLEAFITDLRADLISVTNDSTLSSMPFVIGEIATSFATANNPQVPPFIEVQRSVAEKMNNVYTVATDDLIIVDTDGTVVGSDQYHFTKADQRTLGNRFGDVLLENAVFEDAYVSTSAGGTIEKEWNTAKTELTITVTADEGYALKSLTFDGRNVTAQVQNGKYVAQNPRKGVTCEAVFERAKTSFEIAYEYDAAQGSVQGATSVEEGSTLSVTVTPAEGYEVESVKLGETELMFADGKYTLENVTASGTVTVTFRKKEAPKECLTGTQLGLAIGIPVGVVVIGAAVAAVLIVKKKKR